MSAARTLLLVGPFFGDCDFAPSPAKRLEGYARYLPTSGWRTIVIVTACRCVANAGVLTRGGGVVRRDSELIFDPTVAGARGVVTEALGAFRSCRDTVLILRPVLTPPRSFRAWSALSELSDTPAALIEGKMSRHWLPTFERSGVEPLPTVARPIAKAAASAVGAFVRARGHQAARRAMLEDVVDLYLTSPARADAVLGSHGYAPEVRAAHRAAAADDIPLVVELRDAVSRGWNVLYELAELARIGRVSRSADAVVHVTRQEQDRDRWWLGSHPRLRVIEHGFDPAEWDAIRASSVPEFGRFTLRFLGTLYPDLHLATFLRGYVRFLEGLNERQRAKVRFEYVGPSGDVMRVLVQMYVPERSRDHVVIRDRVGRSDALALMASSDVLVLPMAYGIPGGRFYEYLGSRRPILAAGDEIDPYVADVLRRTDRGSVAVGSAAVEEALRAMLDEPRALSGQVATDHPAIDGFTRRRQADQLAELLQELVSST